MDRKHIRKLYKYLPFSANSISILINKKIWYALPNSLNDPFDCQMVEHSIDADAIEKERKAKYDRVYKEKTTGDKFERKLRKLFRNTLLNNTPAKAGGFKLRTESPDTRRLNDAS